MWPTPGRRSSWPRPPETRADIAAAPAPIRIGYCLSLTGSLADNGRSARLAHEIWRQDVNSRGGPAALWSSSGNDDEGNADNAPRIYERLIDEHDVDLVIGGYGTSTLLPAMPLIVERERFFVGLMGLGVNNALLYPNYFAVIPAGPDPNAALTEGFFALAAEQTPRPETVALVSADAEFSRNPVLGAKANAENYGIRVVHEATCPLSTGDFAPVIDAVARSGSDLLLLCSYLADSVGLARTIRSHRFRPEMVGGAMIGRRTRR
ncbi:ABC transporter substrate-binding protein [Streptomyces sp. RCU064]|uniref:ABC transporter substrate-binding protein n=1 Tax=Streptomyces rugosispiralis TaxID=2967341 RepID=A0ABT1V928_9ACTN|nr:ABC transporter substrate-binding protein [Streptomyces rugosispiralis]